MSEMKQAYKELLETMKRCHKKGIKTFEYHGQKCVVANEIKRIEKHLKTIS